MIKTASKPRKKPAPAKRKPGRPKRAERPIGPAEIAQISELWLRGRTVEDIGHTIGVSRQAISHHLNATIRPLWRDRVAAPLGQELAKIDVLERVAWQQFESQAPCETTEQIKTSLDDAGVDLNVLERVAKAIKRPGQKAWLEIVQWCIEQRCRLAGYYTVKAEKESSGGFRVAGMTAGMVNDEMARRIVKVIRDRQKYEAALKAAEGREN